MHDDEPGVKIAMVLASKTPVQILCVRAHFFIEVGASASENVGASNFYRSH